MKITEFFISEINITKRRNFKYMIKDTFYQHCSYSSKDDNIFKNAKENLWLGQIDLKTLKVENKHWQAT